MRVAKFATPAEEERYGTSLLDAALGYLEAKTGGALQGSLPVRFEALRIPVVRKGENLRLPLGEVTAAEVNQATRNLRRPKTTSERSSVETAIEAAFAKTEAFHGVQVSIKQGLATFRGVPVAAFEAFSALLARVKTSPSPAASPEPGGEGGPSRRGKKKVAVEEGGPKATKQKALEGKPKVKTRATKAPKRDSRGRGA